MGMAPTEKVVLGSIAFAVFWVLAVSKKVPFLPIGRTSGSLLGAALMVIFQVITPEQAYSAIDLPILSFLFGTMLLTAYLDRADMFKYLGKLLSWKSGGAKDLLCRICLVSAISSALFTNDTSCVVLTEFVLKIAREKNIPPHPFLLALVSSANIGSAATPIGNPQNLVIAIQSKVSFGRFLSGILPAMLVGVSVNALLLICMYWKLLRLHKDEENEAVENVSSSINVNGNVVHVDETPKNQTSGNLGAEMDAIEVRNDEFSQTRDRTVVSIELSPMNGILTDGIGNPVRPSDEKKDLKWKRVLWKSCVYLVTIGMLVCLLLGLNMSWTAVTAALALVVLDFQDAGPSLAKVSYMLLIFFCGMFITVDGFNRTGIPTALWELMEPYAQIDHVGGIAVLSIVILLLSNIASNVPTVLLLGGKVAASAAAISAAEEKKAWLILAWVSTVAGNLSLLGSAANLVVCEQALSSPHLPYNLSFWTHLKFGLPSTLIVTAIGLTLIK